MSQQDLAWASAVKDSIHKVPDGQLHTLSKGLNLYDNQLERKCYIVPSVVFLLSETSQKAQEALLGQLPTNQGLGGRGGGSEALYPLFYSGAWRPTVSIIEKHLLKKEIRKGWREKRMRQKKSYWCMQVKNLETQFELLNNLLLSLPS